MMGQGDEARRRGHVAHRSMTSAALLVAERWAVAEAAEAAEVLAVGVTGIGH